MYRRLSPTDDPRHDLAPRDSHESRVERWEHTISDIDDSFMKSLERDANQMTVQFRDRAVAASSSSSSGVDEYFSVRHAPGTAGSMTSLARTSFLISKRRLREWIHLQNVHVPGEPSKTKQYFESCVHLINSLVLQMIVTEVKDRKAEMELAIDPKFITAENILVMHHSIEEGETASFIETGADHYPHANDLTRKYEAMKALGSVVYELLMRGCGPPVHAFFEHTVMNSNGSTELLLSINDKGEKSDKEDADDSKRHKSASNENHGRLSAAMIGAGVPYPLCRFVVDLLGGECSDGLLFRADNSFESFSDIIQDLEQMMKSPEAFIHLAIKDQWRLTFGEKMHGREPEQQQLMDVASRVTGFKTNDALFEALAKVLPQNKPQIALVTGQPGCGKSRLVMETRKSLENQGWFFLSCKFDRIVHSEPLSIMASAFDDFLGECQSIFRLQQIRSQLAKLMQPEDIAIITNYVPRLTKFTDSPPVQMNDFQMKKEQMHQVFSQLLRVLSSCGHPVAFFTDDLQWADTASLDLFLALTRANEPDLSSDRSDKNKQPKVLFIGSYRTNEIEDNLQLVHMLKQLMKNEALDVTNIAVAGFDSDTLNGVVSKSLCLPLRRTKPLTEVILQKTDGIVIHIIEFIGRLTMERILTHSFVKGWEWDSESLECCPISASVAELFTFKLKSLPVDALEGLQICSLFGIQIEQRIISLLEGYDGNNSVNINAGLRVAAEHNLIESFGTNTFKFAHDIIAQVSHVVHVVIRCSMNYSLFLLFSGCIRPDLRR